MEKFQFADVLAGLPLPATEKWPDGVFDVEVIGRGPVSLSLFAPREEDRQTPHDRDEFYIVVAGSGCLLSGDEELLFEQGDAIHVAAGVPHSFRPPLAFTAWVVFFDVLGERR